MDFEVSGSSAAPPLWRRVFDYVRAEAIEDCRDRSWEVRLPVVLFLVYVWIRHMVEIEYGSFIFNGINFGFHELGHIVFRPFGEFLMVAGGTILQCLMPCLAAIALWRQRDMFGIAFCLGWFATNCFGCAIYAMDARGMLNLVLYSPMGQSFGADGMGDWTRMLTTLGLLEWDTKIAFAWKGLGSAAMVLCILLSGWLFWTMHRLRGEPPPPPPAWA
jgi:hypothetical protein